MDIFLLILIGIMSGICASMGLGGGFVLLLYLTWIVQIPQKEAQLLNLLFFLPVSLLSIVLHSSHRLIVKSIVWRAIVYGVMGVFVGAYLSSWVNTLLLTKLFSIFVFMIGCKELFHKKSPVS